MGERVVDLARERGIGAADLDDTEIDLSDPAVRREVLGDELAAAYEELGLGPQADERSVETVGLDAIIALGETAATNQSDKQQAPPAEDEERHQ